MSCPLCHGTLKMHRPSCPAYLGGRTCDCLPHRCPACKFSWMTWAGIVLIVASCVALWYALWMWPKK